MKKLNKKLGEMEYDGLITDSTPPVQVRGGVIAKGAAAVTYPRGTIFAKSTANKKLYVLGSTAESGDTLTADCILCDDTLVEDADITAAMYTAGCFDPNKVTVKDSHTMSEAEKDKLRERGIVFKAAFPAN